MASASTIRTRGLQLIKSAAPEEGKPAVYKFRANDGQPDRDMDRFDVSGWNVDNFNKNGVIFYNHESGLGFSGRKDVLPIGKGRAYVENNALMVDITFDPADEFARKVEQKVAAGYLNAVSVGFRMTGDIKLNELGGIDSKSQDLLEISVVSVPANQRALRVKQVSDSLSPEQRKAFIDSLTPDERPSLEESSMTDPEIKAMVAAEAKRLFDEATAKAQLETEQKATNAALIEAEVAKRVQAAQAAAIDAAKGNRESPVTTPGVKVGDHASKGSGLGLARYIKASAAAKMSGRSVTDVLKAQGYQHESNVVQKALSQGSFTDGGSLVLPEFAPDFIELLRNEVTIRKAGPVQIQMTSGSMTFNAQATAATAAYSGEVTNIADSSLTTSRPLVLSEKKLVALTTMSNDLIRNSSIGAEELVRNDLVRVMAIKEDLAFFEGTGASYEPRGLFNTITDGATPDNVYAMTALTTASNPTVAEVKAELRKAMKVLKQANIPFGRWAWFFTPSVEASILDAAGPGGEGMNQLEREMGERGTLFGVPYFVSNQITQTTESKMLLCDMANVVIGDSLALEVEVFPNGSYYTGSAVVSGISTDQTVVRAIAKHDIGMRHRTAGVVVTGVTWIL